MDNRLYNIYWTETDGLSHFKRNFPLSIIQTYVDIILSSGGEITGIINSEDD